jgi:hypothetical protein
MSDWNTINNQDLDNYITGHYGEDQFLGEGDTDWCFECGLPSDFFADSWRFREVGLCATHAMHETENEVF